MTSSKDEIKVAFTAELKLSSQYQEVLLLKQALLAEIAAPNITAQITYVYTTQMSDTDLQTFRLCYLVEFGWLPEFATNTSITVNMARFLE